MPCRNPCTRRSLFGQMLDGPVAHHGTTIKRVVDVIYQVVQLRDGCDWAWEQASAEGDLSSSQNVRDRLPVQRVAESSQTQVSQRSFRSGWDVLLAEVYIEA